MRLRHQTSRARAVNHKMFLSRTGRAIDSAIRRGEEAAKDAAARKEHAERQANKSVEQLQEEARLRGIRHSASMRKGGKITLPHVAFLTRPFEEDGADARK